MLLSQTDTHPYTTITIFALVGIMGTMGTLASGAVVGLLDARYAIVGLFPLAIAAAGLGIAYLSD